MRWPGLGWGSSPRGAAGAAAAKALMRPPLCPSRRDLNSLFSLEPPLIGLGKAPLLAHALSLAAEDTWILLQHLWPCPSVPPCTCLSALHLCFLPAFLAPRCPSLHLPLGTPSVHLSILPLAPLLPFHLCFPLPASGHPQSCAFSFVPGRRVPRHRHAHLGTETCP